MPPLPAAAVSLCLIGAIALAQQTPTFRTRVDVIHLDVSVLDKNRRPVKGLTAADFTVFDDGKPRPIVAFSSFELDDAPPAPTLGWMSEVPPDVATNDMKETRLFVLVMDDALTPQRPSFASDARRIATSIIDNLGPGDLAAVVFTGDNRKYEDFTNDKTKLRAAIAAFRPGLAGYQFGYETGRGGVDSDILFFLGAVRTLTDVADFMIAAPNRRKVLFWVSPGVPLEVMEAAAPRRASAAEDAPPMSIEMDARDLQGRTQEIFQRAQRANVAVYPIDPTGLGGMLTHLKVNKPIGVGAEAWEAIVTRKNTAQQDFLIMTAANTGGRTVMNTNDYEQGIKDIFTENSAYYLIAFEPANFVSDGKRHRLQVKVNRPDVEVHTHSDYYSPSPDKPDKNATASKISPETAALSRAIGSMLPDGNTPMRVAIAPIAVPGQKAVTVAIALGVRQPVPESARRGQVTDTTELQITAYSPDGKPSGTQRHTARVRIREGAEGEAIYEVLGRIDVAPGRYNLRLAVFNPQTGKSGSVFSDVTIPDYTKVPFAVSPVVLSAWPPRPSAPEDLFFGLLPMPPTAERAFGNTGQVSAFMRLYQSDGKKMQPVTIAMRVRDAADRVLVSEAQKIEAYDFGYVGPTGKSNGLSTADALFHVPLPKFAPGDYLLTIEATRGTTSIRRDVRFSIK